MLDIPWKIAVEKIEAKIEACRQQLETSPDHDTTLRLQGRIAAYREIIGLPQEIKPDPKMTIGIPDLGY